MEIKHLASECPYTTNSAITQNQSSAPVNTHQTCSTGATPFQAAKSSLKDADTKKSNKMGQNYTVLHDVYCDKTVQGTVLYISTRQVTREESDYESERDNVLLDLNVLLYTESDNKCLDSSEQIH